MVLADHPSCPFGRTLRDWTVVDKTDQGFAAGWERWLGLSVTFTKYVYIYIIFMICMDMMYLCHQMFFKHLPQASSELCTLTVKVGFIPVPRFTVGMFTVHALYYGCSVDLA